LVGLLPQLGAIAVVAGHGYLFASDLLLFRNHIYLGLLLGVLVAASPCGRALSIDAFVCKRLGRQVDGTGYLTAGQLIKAQVLIVYAWSAINKLRWSFLDGWTLQQELPHALHQSPIAPWLYGPGGALRPAVAAAIANDGAMAFCSCAVVVTEAFLLWGLPQLRWRRRAACAGLALHGSIFLFMNIITFGLLMVSSYPLFLKAKISDARSKREETAGLCPP
jgi:hypothetical protein